MNFPAPPLNKTYPKYYKGLEEADRDRKPIGETVLAFECPRSLNEQSPLPSFIKEDSIVWIDSHAKKELKKANLRILERMLKCLDISRGLSSEADIKMQYSTKLIEEVKAFVEKCAVLKYSEMRRNVCNKLIEDMEIIREQTKEFKNFMNEIKKKAQCFSEEEKELEINEENFDNFDSNDFEN